MAHDCQRTPRYMPKCVHNRRKLQSVLSSIEITGLGYGAQQGQIEQARDFDTRRESPCTFRRYVPITCKTTQTMRFGELIGQELLAW